MTKSENHSIPNLCPQYVAFLSLDAYLWSELDGQTRQYKTELAFFRGVSPNFYKNSIRIMGII